MVLSCSFQFCVNFKLVIFSLKLPVYVPYLFNLPVIIWTHKIGSALMCHWLCFLLNRLSNLLLVSVLMQCDWYSILVNIYSETILSFLCAWLAKNIFHYLWNSWAVLCQLLGWGGLDGCVTALWIWNCSVLWVVSGKFLKHQQHWEVHCGHLVQLSKCKQFFHQREAELQSSVGVFAVFQ